MDNEHIKRWFKHIVNRKIQSKIEMRYYFISNVWAKNLKKSEYCWLAKGNPYTLRWAVNWDTCFRDQLSNN